MAVLAAGGSQALAGGIHYLGRECKSSPQSPRHVQSRVQSHHWGLGPRPPQQPLRAPPWAGGPGLLLTEPQMPHPGTAHIQPVPTPVPTSDRGLITCEEFMGGRKVSFAWQLPAGGGEGDGEEWGSLGCGGGAR